jgi:exopolysaccharide biosynthesis protein
MDSGIGNFPTLLINGYDTLPLYKNTTLITPKMAGLSNKSFICFTEGGDTHMGIVSKITLAEMPGYLLKLGCRDALNLDNGGSSALYARGKYQV